MELGLEPFTEVGLLGGERVLGPADADGGNVITPGAVAELSQMVI